RRQEAKEKRCSARKEILRFRHLTRRLPEKFGSSKRAAMETAEQNSRPRPGLRDSRRTGPSARRRSQDENSGPDREASRRSTEAFAAEGRADPRTHHKV